MLQNLQKNRLWEYLRRKRFGGMQGVGQPQGAMKPFDPGYNSMYTSPGYRVGSPMPYTNPQATQAPWAQRQAAPYQQQSMQQPYQNAAFGSMNNLGGENLPPLDRNPYSPTQGQGFNLKNMLRKNRPTYY